MPSLRFSTNTGSAIFTSTGIRLPIVGYSVSHPLSSYRYTIAPQAGKISNFTVYAKDCSSSGQTVSLYNYTASTHIDITGLNDDTLVSNTSDELSVSEGDLLYLASTDEYMKLSWRFNFTGSDYDDAQILAVTGKADGNRPVYLGPFMNYPYTTIVNSEYNQSVMFPISGTLRNLKVKHHGSTDIRYTVRQNFSSTALTVLGTAAGQIVTNTSDTVSVSAGDLITFELYTPNISALPSGYLYTISMLFDPDSTNKSIAFGQTTENTSSGSRFINPLFYRGVNDRVDYTWYSSTIYDDILPVLVPLRARLQDFRSRVSVDSAGTLTLSVSNTNSVTSLSNTHVANSSSIETCSSTITSTSTNDKYYMTANSGSGEFLQGMWSFVIYTLEDTILSETVRAAEDVNVECDLYKELNEYLHIVANPFKLLEDNPVYYFDVPDTSQFTIEEADILSMAPLFEDDSNIRNVIKIIGTGVTAETSDSTSIADYGQYTYRLVNDLITTTADAQLLAGQILANYKDLQQSGSIVIEGREDINVDEKFTLNIPSMSMTNEVFQISQYIHKITDKGFFTTIQFGYPEYDIAKALANLIKEVRN